MPRAREIRLVRLDENGDPVPGTESTMTLSAGSPAERSGKSPLTPTWPIIPHVGTPVMEDVEQLIRIADHAVALWYMGPDGPYGRPDTTRAEANHMIVREALLHLLELGLIDIDTERLAAGAEIGYPTKRRPGGRVDSIEETEEGT
jgi:hypothetical protein